MRSPRSATSRPTPALRRALGEMVDDLRNGGLFSASAAQHPQVFPNYYVGILQAAELTGRLDESLDSLAEFIKREMDTRSKVVGALAYPLVVMSMSMVTVLVLAGYVLPQFKPLFEELDAELPLPDPDDAVLRPVLRRPLVHHGRSSSCSSIATVRRSSSMHPTGKETLATNVAQDPGHRGHHRVRDPRTVLRRARHDAASPASRCRPPWRPRPRPSPTSSTESSSTSPASRCWRVPASPSR